LALSRILGCRREGRVVERKREERRRGKRKGDERIG